jgi:hypothetical protein
VAGAALDCDLEPERNQLGRGLRYERDAPLSGSGLARDSDLHGG